MNLYTRALTTLFVLLLTAGCTTLRPCEQYTYSTCPDHCERACIASCEHCEDCDGPGSCREAVPE